MIRKINGVTVATPKSCTVGIHDLDDQTTRNANGDLLRDRIAIKRKLDNEWGPLTVGQMSTLLQAVSSVFFTVEYFDPQTGSYQTKTFYVGDRTAPVYTVRNGVVLWEGLSMNFIER